MITASMDLSPISSSSFRYTLGSAPPYDSRTSLAAASRRWFQMSQTAVTRELYLPLNSMHSLRSCVPRPPGPTIPTRIMSLGRFADRTELATAPRKLRRFMDNDDTSIWFQSGAWIKCRTLGGEHTSVKTQQGLVQPRSI